VAGVGELIMVVPTPNGEKNALVLAAAAISGVDRVFCIGGAQAVGALAYGTETIPQVDKVTGPGNAYVAAAKRRVFGVVGIDMVAGPSEILVICDGKTSDQISERLNLSKKSIDAIRSEISKRIGATNPAEFVRKSILLGLYKIRTDEQIAEEELNAQAQKIERKSLRNSENDSKMN
jgi:hypothetical protein